RQVQETARLFVRPERRRAFGRALQELRGVRPNLIGVGVVGGAAVGVEVMRRGGVDDLVVQERLEMLAGGEMHDLAVALGQRSVRDVSDQRLDEAVLAALW